jgi:regulatory protein
MACSDYFLRLLSRREYSAHELLKKGREKGFDPGEIEDAINELQQKDYQSDIRLVNSLIDSSKGKYGKSMLKRKCFEKGISAELFEQVWSEKTESDSSNDLDDLKNKVMRKYKLDSFQNIDPKTKSKLWSYLQYRGFNPYEILTQWQSEEEDD